AVYGEGDPLLPNTGNIRGTIVDENGNPIDNLEVCAMTEGSTPYTFTDCSRTEEGGQYLIYNVTEQNYLVWANAAWYLGEFREQNYPQIFYPGVTHSGEATWVPVHGEETTTGIDFQVHKGGEIEGTVTDQATGAPIANVEVCPIISGGPDRAERQYCGYTDASGKYLIRDVDTDEYTLQFKTSQWHAPEYEGAYYPNVPNAAEAVPISTTVGETVTGIDEQLRHVGGGEPTKDPGSGTSLDPPTVETLASSSMLGGGGATGLSRKTPRPLVVGRPRALSACPKGFRRMSKGTRIRCVKKASHRANRRKAHRRKANNR
ncbi:MAG TPA: carboxypeptidase-like regulatory domain-containing protein, partial [Solirubrobacterales bacterium]|nr:carboxypeptidase-like regulatory domain-containing protein [Solirubrobacterales bacterium]